MDCGSSNPADARLPVCIVGDPATALNSPFAILSICGVTEQEALQVWHREFECCALLATRALSPPTPAILSRFKQQRSDIGKLQKGWEDHDRNNCISWVMPATNQVDQARIDRAFSEFRAAVCLWLPNATQADVQQLLPQPKD